MDKQKQIEEMAKDLGIAFQLAGTTRFTAVAEILVDKYQPKIPENAMVLTREEYSDYLKIQNNYKHVSERCKELHRDNEKLLKRLGNFKKTIQKETAEKFADMLRCEYIDFCNYDEISVGGLRETIDEICKEITEGKV